MNPQASNLHPNMWSQVGTKEATECSGRGYCNRQTGHCLCYNKFGSSDGKGGSGDLGDCGYYSPYDPPMNCSIATPLWGSRSAVCSGEVKYFGGQRCRVNACGYSCRACSCLHTLTSKLGACVILLEIIGLSIADSTSRRRAFPEATRTSN